MILEIKKEETMKELIDKAFEEAHEEVITYVDRAQRLAFDYEDDFTVEAVRMEASPRSFLIAGSVVNNLNETGFTSFFYTTESVVEEEGRLVFKTVIKIVIRGVNVEE